MTDAKWVPKVGDEVTILEWVGVVSEVRTYKGRTKVRIGDQDYTLDELRPADEPSVDEMFKAICPDETGEVIRVWRTEDGGVIVHRCLEDEPPHCGPTLDDAIRAAFEAVTKR